MKKLAAISLAVIYFLATVGTVIAMHFCMGRELSTTVGLNDTTTCKYCHMAKSESDKSGCCKDENHFVKLTIDHQLPDYVAAPQTPVLLIQALISPLADREIQKTELSHYYFSDPPDIPIYNRNCNFRI